MTEMQTYLPIPEPVKAWQWDGKPRTTAAMLKRWAYKIAYTPATPKRNLMTNKVEVEPHHLRINLRGLEGVSNDTWVTVDVGDYIVETDDGIYRTTGASFEPKHLLADVSADTLPHVSRIEVIKDNNRDYVKYGFAGATVAIQDEGRTIKVFARSAEPKLPDFVKIAEALVNARDDKDSCEHCGMDKEFHEKNDGCF